MQPVKSNPQKKKSKHGGIKYILSTVSLISVVGLWQQFSNNDVVKSAKQNNTALEPVDNQIRFQPLPTLMPVQNAVFTSPSGTLSDQNVDSSGLRQVTAPTLQPRTQAPITLQQVIINNPGTGSNNGPVTRTGSSR
jgi:hypothetical protein